VGRLAHRSHETIKTKKEKSQAKRLDIFYTNNLYKRKAEIYMKKAKKIIATLALILILSSLLCVTAFAAPAGGGVGDVAGAVEQTWRTAAVQVKAVVNNVVFPVCATILAIFFFVKLGTAYFDYRKHGQFEWAAPAILFGCLVFIITAPLYIWNILGI